MNVYLCMSNSLSVDNSHYSGYFSSVVVACVTRNVEVVGSIPCSANSMLTCVIVHVYMYVIVK